jgi:hypothetical protein
VRLRARLGRPGCEDRDQRVLSAFLETARALSSDTYVARLLWLGVRGRLHAERAKDRRAPQTALFDDDTYVADRHDATSHEKVVLAEVLGAVTAEGGVDLREALLEKHAVGTTIKEYVDRTYPGLSPRERAGLCERLYRVEVAVFRKLRARTVRRERAYAAAA